MSDLPPSLTDSAVRPGAILGRYELLAPIATGGMAHVWAARLLGHGAFSKIVALKMILPSFASDHGFEQMFFDEARIAAKVRHPNVCATFDLGEHDGTLFLAMEWVEGVSLLSLLRPTAADAAPSVPAPARAISQRLGARIIADACAGLHAAHELADDDGTPLNVVHRDVSPHNLLVSRNGDVKVTDFGVATARGKTHKTAAGQIKGKISYMSPEHLKGAAVDGRSDVFALGCVLYEITTGRRPFRGGEAQTVSAILLGQMAALPSALVRGYSAELEAIIVRALAGDPDARFQSADAMRAALEAYLAKGEPVLPSALAALVEERCGDQIARRREEINAECAQRGGLSSAPPPPPSPSLSPPPPLPASARVTHASGATLSLLIVAGVLAALIMAAGWYAVVARGGGRDVATVAPASATKVWPAQPASAAAAPDRAASQRVAVRPSAPSAGR